MIYLFKDICLLRIPQGYWQNEFPQQGSGWEEKRGGEEMGGETENRIYYLRKKQNLFSKKNRKNTKQNKNHNAYFP